MPCVGAKGPSWLDKVTFIADYAVHGCGTTLRVYVRTGIQAEKNLVMALAGISSTEAVYTLLRPKAGRSTRHGGNKGKRGKAIGKGSKLGRALLHGEEALPDSANLIANTVQTITGWERPVYNAAGEFLFEVAAPLIRIGYYVTLVNAAADFGYDWYSGILMAPQSDCNRGRFNHIMSIPAPTNHGYINLGTGFPLFEDKDVHDQVDAILLDKGRWIITVRTGLEQSGFPDSDADMFTKLMYGENLDQQCGQAVKLEYKQGDGYVEKKFARVIQGPERIAVFQSLHKDNPSASFVGETVELYGFRVQEP